VSIFILSGSAEARFSGRTLTESPECEWMRDFNEDRSLTIHCLYPYHHYIGDGGYKKSREIQIASFNLWHPGTMKSIHKDYSLVAKMMNKWDIVGAQELVSLIKEDEAVNEKLVEYLDEQSGDSEEYENGVKALRKPGYYRLLIALRKLDPSWSLIITSKGQATQAGSLAEHVGYYYRSSVVEPVEDPHCREYDRVSRGRSYACIPSFGKKFMGKNVDDVFARKPFIARFESGKFDFTLISSHVIYATPKGDRMAEVLMPSFGVEDYKDLPVSVSKSHYARFAEVKVTLDFMSKYRKKYDRDQLIFFGDLNVEYGHKMWDHVLPSYPGSVVAIEEPTSLTMKRFQRNGAPSEGFASNYDHFIANPKVVKNCAKSDKELDASRYSFMTGEIADEIDENYVIRTDGPGNYSYRSGAKSLIEDKVKAYTKFLKGRQTVSRGKLVDNMKNLDFLIDDFRRRVFEDQLSDFTYYKVFRELISDHVPVVLTCSTAR
jgi:hypothetical protein